MSLFNSSVHVSGDVEYDSKKRTFKIKNANSRTRTGIGDSKGMAILTFGASKIASDVTNAVTTGTKGPFPYEALIDYQIVQDNGAETKGGASVGRAIGGGLLFGTAGAIIGGVTGKKQQNEVINQLEIQVTINHDGDLKTYNIEYIESPTKAKNCKTQIHRANETLAALSYIKSEGAQTARPNSDPIEQAPQKPDKYEELKKLKELMDDGIITEDEFEAKKKQILGL